MSHLIWIYAVYRLRYFYFGKTDNKTKGKIIDIKIHVDYTFEMFRQVFQKVKDEAAFQFR